MNVSCVKYVWGSSGDVGPGDAEVLLVLGKRVSMRFVSTVRSEIHPVTEMVEIGALA